MGIKFTEYPKGLSKLVMSELTKLPKDKLYKVEITEAKSKRSIEQNKFLWVGIGKISKELGQPEMKTYCDLLIETGAKFDFIMARDGLEKTLLKSFRAVQYVRPSHDHEGYSIYKVFAGSSRFSTKEMTDLIDVMLDWQTRLGINDLDFDERYQIN